MKNEINKTGDGVRRKNYFPLIFIFFFISGISCAQDSLVPLPDIGSPQYELLKKEGKLPHGPVVFINHHAMSMQMKPKIMPSPASSVLCNCMIPIDASFSVVPFVDASSTIIPPDYRNDDGSSPQITLPFNFCFYGQTMNNCYINNNGNISFGLSYGTFTANSFPDSTFIMIAPFWGDVDTRNPASGIVYYKITSTYMVVRWQNVDYYDSDPSENAAHQPLYNDFQLIITNGSDPILPSGNNVNFCYGDMQWTTGDASSGNNGFGGSPATVGVNRGNGTDFIQIGQFDSPGTNYDGPFGNPDGVSWLDNQTFYFDVCNNGSGNNLPPILNSAEVCDTIILCIGDTTAIDASFLSPENGQITVANITSSISGLTITSNTSGNPAVISATLIANAVNTGYNTITLTGTDNGSPPATTTANVIVDIISFPSISFTMWPPPVQPAGVTVTFTDNTPGATSWLWDFGDGNTSTLQNPAHTYATDSLYTVTLTVSVGSGCTASLSQLYLVQTEIPLPPVIAPNVVTPNGDNVNDVLVFTNLDKRPHSSLLVYNRWGNLIYESNNYQNDWKPNVNDGVYYYVLSGPYIEKPMKGFFHVIRDK
ncbi:MAG: gliding motility-associated C-terminal domain-containing protein [Bacteroidetes bacterium]|nr:gliding motility-associated C-terminal domain-containing protein [Bacteroidota bacterium]